MRIKKMLKVNLYLHIADAIIAMGTSIVQTNRIIKAIEKRRIR